LTLDTEKRHFHIMPQSHKKRIGRPPDGIARRPMTINLPVIITERLRGYSVDTGESASNLIARLVAEFFRTGGQPPGNVRATLKVKLEKL
jgi:hypothetical protein